MRIRLYILLILLLSCEEIPTPGGSDSGCTGSYSLSPYSDELDINLIQSKEEEIELYFIHDDDCIIKYNVVRLSSDGQTVTDVINVDSDTDSEINYTDDINIRHGITYFYTIAGQDTYGNFSNNLSSNITPVFLAEISDFSVMYNEETQNIDLSWGFSNNGLSDYSYDIEWKDSNADNYELLTTINDAAQLIYSFAPVSIEPNDYYSFRIRINTAINNSDWTVNNNYTGTGQNYAPILSDINNQVMDEDSEISIQLIASDQNFDNLFYSAESDNFDIMIEIYGDILTIIPPENYFGSHLVTVNVSDGNEGDDTTDFNLTINPVNDSPVLEQNIASMTVLEDFIDIDIDLGDYFTDVDQDSLLYTYTTIPNNVISTVLNGSVLTLSSIQDIFGGPVLVTVTADDNVNRSPIKKSFNKINNRSSVTGSFNISVNPVNDIPVLNSISNQIMDEDTSISLQLSAYDVDGDYLTYNEDCSASNNIDCQTNGNILTLIPESNWNGTVQGIQVQANDGSDNSNIVSFDLVVNEVNDDPDAIFMENLILVEDFTPNEEINLSNYFSDIENGDNLSYTASVDNLTIINVSVLDNILTISPVADQNGGPITVTVTANDATGRNTVQSSFNVNVTPVNDAPPVLTFIDTQNINEDEPLTLILDAFDYDGDNLTYTATCDAHTNCSIAGSVLTVNPDVDYYGLENISVTVDDGYQRSSDSQAFNLNVAPVNNDNPVLEFISNGSTDEEVQFSTILEISDVDENPEFFIETSGDNVDITITEIGNFTYELKAIPDENYNGISNIDVIVRDNEYNTYGTHDSQDFDLTVDYVADPPTIAAIDSQTVYEDQSLTVALDIQDPDTDYGDVLDVVCSTFNSDINCVITNTTPSNYSLEISGDPDYFIYNNDIKVTVTDSDAGPNEDEDGILLPNEVETTFNLDIISVNDNPIISSSDFTSPLNSFITEDESKAYAFVISDIDSELDDNENLVLEVTSNYVNYSYDEYGQMLVDEDGNPIFLIQSDADVWQIVDEEYDDGLLSSFHLQVTPDNNYNSDLNNDGQNDQFIQLEVKVTDNLEASASLESVITILSVNDLPEITINNVEGQEDAGGMVGEDGIVEDGAVSQVVFTVNDVEDANDYPYDFTLVYDAQVVAQAPVIIWNEEEEAFTFDLTSIPNYFGITDLNITVIDSNDDSSTEDFIWTVASVQDEDPVLDSFSLSDFNEDQSLDILLSATDLSDVYAGYEGDISFSATSSNTNISVDFQTENSIDTSGVHSNTLTISATENWNGDADITVTVTDYDGGFYTSTVTPFTIVAVNDLPEISINSLQEIINPIDGLLKTYQLSDYASDVDSPVLYYQFEDNQISDEGVSLTLIQDEDGIDKLELNVIANFILEDSYTYDNILIMISDCDPDEGSETDPQRCESIEHLFSLTLDKEALGCMDENSCNYDIEANVDNGTCLYNDCNGDCNGLAQLNQCNECIYGNTGIEEDIGDNGVYGTDCFGVCNGLATEDCAGECNGSAVIDVCGVCGGTNIEDQDGFVTGPNADCTGVCGGEATEDECGTCDSIPLNDCVQDCDGEWGGNAVEDCAGVCNGDAEEDVCGVCNGDGPQHVCEEGQEPVCGPKDCE